MEIACVMGTGGRYSLACEALACFLGQTMIESATLLIYNQHPQPVFIDHPRVRVVNDARPQPSLRAIRRAMHDLVPPTADFIHWWDDDDLYLPWHLEDCVTHIGDAPAWRPKSHWASLANLTVKPIRNHRCEGSWLFRSEALRSAPIETHPGYSDHPAVLQIEQAGLLAMTELNGLRSYIYRWSNGAAHHSTLTGEGTEVDQAASIAAWRERSQDVVPDGVMIPFDMTRRWVQFVKAIETQVEPEELAVIRKRLCV